MILPVQQLELSTYKDVIYYCKVFNLLTLDTFLWIHIPDELSRCCKLFSIDELLPTKKSPLFQFNEFIVQERCKPWLRVRWDKLNQCVGQHTYRFQFVNRHTNDVIDLYIRYIIQNDDPKKPYIYMDRHEEDMDA